MAFPLQTSPFVSVSNDGQPIVIDDQEARRSFDYLGKSTAGELHWNNNAVSLGLICGSSESEISAITQRLILSHVDDPEAQVLIFHTDRLSIQAGPCSLLNSIQGRPLVLVSPNAVNRVVEAYTSAGAQVAPIVFTETSITLRHVLALFNPPADMEGRTSIISTIQLILSQLGESFDLQRFIELVDQETWNADGVNFMAMRQTLLMKLLSPIVENAHQDKPRQTTLIDLTDPILRSTGLDSSIMDIALYDFICSSGGRKMIVLNNCHQYLTHNSNFTKTLEAITALGNDRPTSIILSTTDPTIVSAPLLNSIDYVISGSTRSFLWSAFLRRHFANIDLSKVQPKSGRAMIWSPESTLLVRTIADEIQQKPWNDDQAFIDIDQLKPTTQPGTSLYGSCVDDFSFRGAEEGASRVPTTKQVPISAERSHDYGGGGREEEEEEIILQNSLGLSEMRSHLANDLSSLSRSRDSVSQESPSPFSMESTSAFGSPPARSHQSGLAAQFAPLTSIISMLSDGNLGTFVDYVAVREEVNNHRYEFERFGWNSTKLSDIVALAHQERVIELIKVDGAIKFLKLLPVPRPPNGLPSSKPRCLEKFAPLVAVVLKHSGGRIGYKVRLAPVLMEAGIKKTKQFMTAHGWYTVEAWIRDACSAGELKQGSMKICGKWIMVPIKNNDGLIKDDRKFTTVLPAAAASEQNRPIEESATFEQTQLHVKFEPLVACISRLGGNKPDSRASYIAVKQEMECRKLKLQGLGWSSFEMLRDAAYMAGVVQHIKKGRTTKLEYLQLIPQLPHPLHPRQVKLAEYPIQPPSSPIMPNLTRLAPRVRPEVGLPKATEHPLEHHQVVTAVPKSISAAPAGVPMTELETNAAGVTWVTLPRIGPSAPPSYTPSASLDPIQSFAVLMAKEEMLNPPSGATLLPSFPPRLVPQSVPTRLGVEIPSDLATVPAQWANHHVVVSVIQRLTNGAASAKVTLTDLTASMHQCCSEAMVVPLIFQAKEEGILLYEADNWGTIWVWINDVGPSPSSNVVPTTLLPPPVSLPAIVQRISATAYPAKHRAVVIVLVTLTGGIPKETVRMNEYMTSLRRKYKGAREDFLLTLIAKAVEEGVMAQGRGEDDVEWICLNPAKDVYARNRGRKSVQKT